MTSPIAKLQAAAASVAARQRSLAQQTAAAKSQLPKIYGGAGTTSGLSAQVSFSGVTAPTLPSGFTNNGPLTATLSGTSTPGAQFAALFDQVADTDQVTTSGIWSSPITLNGGARYLFLRVNSTFTSYLYAKWFAATPSAGDGNNFNVELGCVVAGVKTVFKTFGSPTTLLGQQLIVASSNANISLEATADAITFTYPATPSGENASLSFTDTSGVSQIGAGFRQAGFGTDE